jgi:hypothetical protein
MIQQVKQKKEIIPGLDHAVRISSMVIAAQERVPSQALN